MTTVQDVMTGKVIAVTKQSDFKQIVSVLRQYRVSACPVVDAAGQVVGVVSEADLLFKETDPELPAGQIRLRWRLAEESKATAITAEQLMSSPAVTINPGASVVDAARLMQDRQVKQLPVVGAGGQLIGIISRSDVLSVYERPDADILADITKGVIAQQFGLDPADVDATVMAGVVTMTGLVERTGTALGLLARIRHVEGVVAVRSRLTVSEASEASRTG